MEGAPGSTLELMTTIPLTGWLTFYFILFHASVWYFVELSGSAGLKSPGVVSAVKCWYLALVEMFYSPCPAELVMRSRSGTILDTWSSSSCLWLTRNQWPGLMKFRELPNWGKSIICLVKREPSQHISVLASYSDKKNIEKFPWTFLMKYLGIFTV